MNKVTHKNIKHYILKFLKDFKASIIGTTIELTLEEMNAFMVEGMKNEEDRGIINYFM